MDLLMPIFRSLGALAAAFALAAAVGAGLHFGLLIAARHFGPISIKSVNHLTIHVESEDQ